MQTLLALPEPPTAVFAAADLMAVGAMKAARDAGLDVPADLAVVGFDDIHLASLLDPALTTIHQDKVGLGQAAARALLEQIENPEMTPAALTLPVELIIRASCGWTREAVGATTTITRGPIAERAEGGEG
jgi:LacI family transcriptional regulator